MTETEKIYEVMKSIKMMESGEDMKINLAEMDKLAQGLTDRHIPYIRLKLYDGEQIRCKTWDVVCHRGSYGGLSGYLEITGEICQSEDDEVEGWLTAEDILARL